MGVTLHLLHHAQKCLSTIAIEQCKSEGPIKNGAIAKELTARHRLGRGGKLYAHLHQSIQQPDRNLNIA